MLLQIYLPQTKKVLVLFGFVLLPIIFFSFVAYENLQETQKGKKILLVCLVSIVVLIISSLAGFLIREIKLRRKIWSVEAEDGGDETDLDLNQRIDETTNKIVFLNEEMAGIFGQIHYGRLKFDDADIMVWQLINQHEKVVRKFLFSAISLHNASKIICAGQSGHLIKNFLIYNRNGQKYNVLVLPFLCTENFKNVLKIVGEKKITLVIALYSESDYSIEGVKIISLPTYYPVIKGVWIEVCERIGKEEYVF